MYSDRLFLKALVIMIVRHLHKGHELLSVLAQPTAEMATLRSLLSEQGRFPSRRIWERRLKSLPVSLPAQIGCLGHHLITLIQPWANCGRAVAIDSTDLRACGGIWHQKHREQADRLLVATRYGRYPHTDDGVEVRRVFHKLRSTSIENFNEHFKGIFDGHGQVPTKGLIATQRFALGAIFVSQLALLYRFEHDLPLCVGLKAFLKAA